MRNAVAKQATPAKVLALVTAAARADGVALLPRTAVQAVTPLPARALVSPVRSTLAAQPQLHPLL
jgi:hypothetical protein